MAKYWCRQCNDYSEELYDQRQFIADEDWKRTDIVESCRGKCKMAKYWCTECEVRSKTFSLPVASALLFAVLFTRSLEELDALLQRRPR